MYPWDTNVEDICKIVCKNEVVVSVHTYFMLKRYKLSEVHALSVKEKKSYTQSEKKSLASPDYFPGINIETFRAQLLSPAFSKKSGGT